MRNIVCGSVLILAVCGSTTDDDLIGGNIGMSGDLAFADEIARLEYPYRGYLLVPAGTSSTASACDVNLSIISQLTETSSIVGPRQYRYGARSRSIISESPLVVESRWRVVAWATKDAGNRPSDWYVAESQVLEYPLAPCLLGTGSMCPQGEFNGIDLVVRDKGPDCSR